MNKKSESTVEGLGNVDQIRDIIFGSQMRDFNNRFTQIEQQLSRMEETMKARIDEVRESLQKESLNATELLEKKLKSHAALSQEERDELKEQINRSDKRTTIALESLNDESDTKFKQLKAETDTLNKTLKEDLHLLKSAIYSDLEKQFADMGDTKLSRDDMAEMLLELAMRVKGSEIELPQLDERL